MLVITEIVEHKFWTWQKPKFLFVVAGNTFSLVSDVGVTSFLRFYRLVDDVCLCRVLYLILSYLFFILYFFPISNIWTKLSHLWNLLSLSFRKWRMFRLNNVCSCVCSFSSFLCKFLVKEKWMTVSIFNPSFPPPPKKKDHYCIISHSFVISYFSLLGQIFLSLRIVH